METIFVLNSKSRISEIQEVLKADGYPSNAKLAAKVKHAYAAGTLLWTTRHLVIIGGGVYLKPRNPRTDVQIHHDKRISISA